MLNSTAGTSNKDLENLCQEMQEIRRNLFNLSKVLETQTNLTICANEVAKAEGKVNISENRYK